VGSTQWAEGLSLRDQSLALSRFESAAWSSAVLAGGRVVKMIGDAVFFAAPSAEEACRIAIQVCRAAELDPLLPPARGAVGRGPVISREGDYFGPLVNLVARLVKAAEPGTVVATEEVAASLPPDHWIVLDRGPELLRGLEQPVRVFAVTRADEVPSET
jgi:adenylate cyclase